MRSKSLTQRFCAPRRNMSSQDAHLALCTAYGARGVPKLVEALRSADADDPSPTRTALTTLHSLLSTQENKCAVIQSEDAVALLTAQLAAPDEGCRRLAALVIGALASRARAWPLRSLHAADGARSSRTAHSTHCRRAQHRFSHRSVTTRTTRRAPAPGRTPRARTLSFVNRRDAYTSPGLPASQPLRVSRLVPRVFCVCRVPVPV